MAECNSRANRTGLGNLTPDERSLFETFKQRCEAEGFLKSARSETQDDLKEGIWDDGTLL